MDITNTTVVKADRFKAMQEGMSLKDIPLEWLYGNVTNDPLRFGFYSKRVVHPTIKSPLIKDKALQNRWSQFMTMEDNEGSRVAYIHIPFCISRCHYCGFFQHFVDRGLEDAFIDSLIKELRMAEDARFIQCRPFNAVYIGGGTPSALKTDSLRGLLNAIRNSIPMKENCEFTMEGSLQTFTEETFELCRDSGINRLSFGVQSFNTSVRRLVGRMLSGQEVHDRLNRLVEKADSMEMLIVIDLIFGLPLQHMPVWEEDIDTYIASKIHSADFYQLNVFSDSRLKEFTDKGLLPSQAGLPEQAMMFAKAVDIMERKGQLRLSNIHWARTHGERNLYNSLSKAGSTIIPFGPGAGGRVMGSTTFITKDIDRYIKEIDEGVKPLMFMTEPIKDYQVYYQLIGQLDRGFIDLRALQSHYPQYYSLAMELIQKWQSRGFVFVSDAIANLTLAGQFWYVNLTQALIDWLQLKTGGMM